MEEDRQQKARALDLPREAHHLIAEQSALKLNGKIKHCLRSAHRHLRLSWTLHPVDSEMSLFRAITAEEEAATALMLALSQRRYPGSELLKTRDHRHKSAITPFLWAVNNMLANSNIPTPKLEIMDATPPKLRLTLDIGSVIEHPEPLIGEPDHPLNFVLRAGGDKSIYRFETELQEIVSNRSAKDIGAFIEGEANLRNRLLYADDAGYPTVEFPDNTILERRDRVYRLTLLTIAILQTSEHQLFAAQCLEVFLAVLGKVVPNGLDFDTAAPPTGLHMSIIQQPNGSYDASIYERHSFQADIGLRWLAVEKIHVEDVQFDCLGEAIQ